MGCHYARDFRRGAHRVHYFSDFSAEDFSDACAHARGNRTRQQGARRGLFAARRRCGFKAAFASSWAGGEDHSEGIGQSGATAAGRASHRSASCSFGATAAGLARGADAEGECEPDSKYRADTAASTRAFETYAGASSDDAWTFESWNNECI